MRYPFALSLCVFTGCIDRPVSALVPITQSGVSEVIHTDDVDKVDLLLMIDNSSSMSDNQTNIMRQFGRLVTRLTNPPCVSRRAPDPAAVPSHDCDATNPDDVPQYRPVTDLRVGVVSSDLGTPGVFVPSCQVGSIGDDGQLNPIADGAALQYHLPWSPRIGSMAAPPGFRPDGCTDPAQFPRWIDFVAGRTDVAGFERDFECNAGLYVNGCGLESQLEAVWRTLLWNGAYLPAGAPGKSNAGFLREDAILAIVLLTDEEDGSVQNCDYATNPLSGETTSCDPTRLGAYKPGGGYPTDDLNARFYRYPDAGGEFDPTWDLDRYIDPRDPTHGLLALKPGHPERILFAAIAGVPLALPTRDGGTDWDALLGAPGPNGPDDFDGRVNDGDGAALSVDTPSGPISMRRGVTDERCPTTRTVTVPACYAPGVEAGPGGSCPAHGYFALPSRRIVEVARRFDQLKGCPSPDGLCHAGIVTSVCSDDFRGAVDQIVTRVQQAVEPRCLPRVLVVDHTTAAPYGTVQCSVRELLPVREAGDPVATCDAALGQHVPDGTAYAHADASPCTRAEAEVSPACRTVCVVDQVPFDDRALPVTDDANGHHAGWFYDQTIDPAAPSCRQRISFTRDARPASGDDHAAGVPAIGERSERGSDDGRVSGVGSTEGDARLDRCSGSNGPLAVGQPRRPHPPMNRRATPQRAPR